MKRENKERQTSSDENHSHQSDVARRAYELYEARGGQPGHELEDWLQAEREMSERVQTIRKADER